MHRCLTEWHERACEQEAALARRTRPPWAHASVWPHWAGLATGEPPYLARTLEGARPARRVTQQCPSPGEDIDADGCLGAPGVSRET